MCTSKGSIVSPLFGFNYYLQKRRFNYCLFCFTLTFCLNSVYYIYSELNTSNRVKQKIQKLIYTKLELEKSFGESSQSNLGVSPKDFFII